MLAVFTLTNFGGVPSTSADPRPFIPPLATCNNYGVCPSRTAACIGLPYIPTCDPAVTPTGEAWNLTLHEAINTALSNSEAVRNLGLVEAASRNDIVRSIITTYDPLEADALADSEWGIFDPLWTTEVLWDKQDIPPGTSFSGIGNRPPQLDTADAYTSLEQLLPIGTRVRADWVTNYLFNPANPPGLNPNPQYFTYNQIGVSQPLLRGLGVDVTMAPIKIAAAEAERTDWQFKQEMLALVRSIETTYWGLYAQQQNLRVIEQAIPHFREVVRLRQEQAGGTVGTESEVARAQSEMYLFEQRRLDTLSKIAEQALVLRNLMGLPPDDCRDIMPLAVPVTTRPFESLQQAVDTAVNSRPDVLRQRLAVYVASQERLLADNALKPQLDLNGFYRINGLGEELDESWENKDDNNFDSWNMGVFFQIPLGRRQGRSELRAAELRMARERAMLQQTAHQASYEVADAYRRINWVYQQLQIAANRQQALDQWSQGAKAQFDNPPPGMTTVFALELYLQNLRDITDASISTNALLADYNSALARLEEVKGTLLENRNVAVAGDVSNSLPGQLPAPEIQMPESVMPPPAAQPAPAPQQTPAVQPANPAPPQGAIGAPPVEIASEPAVQPLPAPAIEQPQSLTPVPNAYADLPIGPSAAPAVEPRPAPVVQSPAPQITAPMAPPMATPEPAYTARRTETVAEPAQEAPLEPAPTIEPPVAIAPPAAPPVAQQYDYPLSSETWTIEQPLTQRPLAAAPVTEAPQLEEPAPSPSPPAAAPWGYDPLQPAPALAMPPSMMPSSTMVESPATPQVLAPVPAPLAAPAITLPRSIQAAPRPAEAARPVPATTPLPAASLQMPASVRPAAQQARPAQPTASAPTAAPVRRTPAPAQLQMPGSVRPAGAVSEPRQSAPVSHAATPMVFPASVAATAVR